MPDTVNRTYLIQGVLAMHWPVTFGTCRCGQIFPTQSLMREHIAEEIAHVLEQE